MSRLFGERSDLSPIAYSSFHFRRMSSEYHALTERSASLTPQGCSRDRYASSILWFLVRFLLGCRSSRTRERIKTPGKYDLPLPAESESSPRMREIGSLLGIVSAKPFPRPALALVHKHLLIRNLCKNMMFARNARASRVPSERSSAAGFAALAAEEFRRGNRQCAHDHRVAHCF
jgi:hypothetical protein